MIKGFKIIGIITLFWLILSWLFHTDNLSSDGVKAYGLPYKVLVFYWSRKENVRYDYYIDYRNFIYNLIFIIIVSVFYYLAFKKRVQIKE